MLETSTHDNFQLERKWEPLLPRFSDLMPKHRTPRKGKQAASWEFNRAFSHRATEGVHRTNFNLSAVHHGKKYVLIAEKFVLFDKLPQIGPGIPQLF